MIPGQLLANPGSGGEQDLAPLSLCLLLSDGAIVLNLEVAARKKQVGWVLFPLFISQRASGGGTRVERHLALHHSGKEDHGISV